MLKLFISQLVNYTVLSSKSNTGDTYSCQIDLIIESDRIKELAEKVINELIGSSLEKFDNET